VAGEGFSDPDRGREKGGCELKKRRSGKRGEDERRGRTTEEETQMCKQREGLASCAATPWGRWKFPEACLITGTSETVHVRSASLSQGL